MNQATNMQVQMLKDGNRTIIIINGAGKKEDELAYKLISTYYANSLNVNDGVPTDESNNADTKNKGGIPDFAKKVEGLEPPPEPHIQAPSDKEIKQMEDYSTARLRNTQVISGGPYKGITTLAALHKDGERALVALNKYVRDKKNSPERDEIISTCKQYMVSLPTRVSEFYTRDRKCNFLKTLSEMSTITPFISGYADVNAFSSYASDKEVDAAVNSLATALSERGMKKVS